MFWIASKHWSPTGSVEQAVPNGMVYPASQQIPLRPDGMPAESPREFQIRPRAQKPLGDQSGTMEGREQGSNRLVPVNDPNH